MSLESKKIKLDSEVISKASIKSDSICNPIKDLESALKYKDALIPSRKYFKLMKNSYVTENSLDGCHEEISKFSAAQRIQKDSVPKTLVCHDMKGGYLEDKYVDGCEIGNGYTFYRWSNIDIFVYFSHHFVTIPPPGWVNVAHKNNVKILGTLITEGPPGVEMCEKIFSSPETWRNFARSLINICILHSFDGWLLNIENPVGNTKPIIEFIKYLTIEMRKINNEFVVLWYDSIIQNGKLKWQDELNDLNKCFFDVCDGIFLNYSWKEINLENSVLKAGHRKLDVFVGIDVFGRNFFGGGGFNSHAAAKVIRKYGLSAAIFAPGWTHETFATEDTDNFFDLFSRRDNGFWLNLHPYLYTHPIVKSFVTTFNLGSNKKCYNLNNQEVVPTRPTHCGNDHSDRDLVVQQCDCIQLNSEGCKPETVSYQISTSNLDQEKTYVHKLFTCNIDVVKNMAVSCVLKTIDSQNSDLSIIMLMTDAAGRRYCYKYLGRTEENLNPNDIFVVSPLLDTDPNLNVVRKYNNFGDINNQWVIRDYFVAVPMHMKILEIGVKIIGTTILLGGLAVQTNLNIHHK